MCVHLYFGTGSPANAHARRVRISGCAVTTRLTVLVPAYNEGRTIVETLRRVRAQRIPGYELEILVVDDGSTDATAELLEQHPELYDQLIRRQRNGGKGAAVKDGLAAATGDYLIFQDADLEYDPADFAALLVPVTRFSAEIVIGSRLTAPPFTRVYYFWHRVGNVLLTTMFNILHNTTFTDIYSGYLLYRRSLVSPNELRTLGWEQQAEILSLTVRRARIVYEVPISYHGRDYAEGKKIRGRDAVAVALTILREGLVRRGKRSADV